MVACTGDDAIVDDLSQQDASVTVRMQVSEMKETASRAAEKDSITSIVALVFRNKQLQSVTEYSTANSALHPISPIAGTITINKPENDDVIHFLANLPANYSNEKTYIQYLNEIIGQSQEDVLCNLTSSDYSKLSYWGMATYNSNDAVMDVLLYRNKAMIEIKPDEGCTFQENELFIAGLDNPNNVGKLVPYNDGFNFNLDSNDYLTIPDNPNPLDKTDELTNYGAGYDNAYYVFEHENPKDANGLYVICKIGNDYYKVALQDDAGNHYPIIRNHKYTILVKDLDAGSDTYADALNAEPVNLKVTVSHDVTFNYTDNSILNLNNNETYSVTMNVSNDGSLSSISIAAEGFTVSSQSQNGVLSGPNNNVYTYTGGTTTFTFTPTSAGNRTITFSDAQGTDLNISYLPVIDVKVNATIIATPTQQTIYYDGNNKSFNVSVNIPKGVNKLTIDGTGSFNVTPQSQNGTLIDNNYTPDNTNGQTAVFTFTYNGAQSESTQTITFKDASNNPNVTSAPVDVYVKATPQQGAEVPIWIPEEGSTGIAFGGWKKELLLKGIYTGDTDGLVESNKEYFVAGATIKVEFEAENANSPSLVLATNGNYNFNETIVDNLLSYTFITSDFSEEGKETNVVGHGLYLIGQNVIVTKISIIPASTTK